MQRSASDRRTVLRSAGQHRADDGAAGEADARELVRLVADVRGELVDLEPGLPRFARGKRLWQPALSPVDLGARRGLEPDPRHQQVLVGEVAQANEPAVAHVVARSFPRAAADVGADLAFIRGKDLHARPQLAEHLGRQHQVLASAFTAGHCRRLTGSRSTTPSSTTDQPAPSPSPSAERSKPRTRERATRHERCTRTKTPRNSSSRLASDSSSRNSRSSVRTVTYFSSAFRNTISMTGTRWIRPRSLTDRKRRGPWPAAAAARSSGSRRTAPPARALASAADRREARTGFSR